MSDQTVTPPKLSWALFAGSLAMGLCGAACVGVALGVIGSVAYWTFRWLTGA